jgi:hypothetical protein
VSAFCGHSAIAHSVAVPILVVDTPRNIPSVLPDPSCIGSDISYDITTDLYTFAAGGVYTVHLEAGIQPPLSLVNLRLIGIMNPGLTDEVVGDASFTFDETVLASQQMATDFTFEADVGEVFLGAVSSDTLGSVIVSGSFSIQKMGELAP